MSCACRTTPLRLFVRSLAQLAPSPSTRPNSLAVAAVAAVATRRFGSSSSSNAPSSRLLNPLAQQQQQQQQRGRSAHPTHSKNRSAARHATAQEAGWEKRAPGGGKWKPKRPPLLPTGEEASAPEQKDIPLWRSQKEALKKKFPDGWNPRKRLSPDAMDGMRALNAQWPDEYTTPVLAGKFGVPAEAVRRILKGKWRPRGAEEEAGRMDRWNRRGGRIKSFLVEVGERKGTSEWDVEVEGGDAEGDLGGGGEDGNKSEGGTPWRARGDGPRRRTQSEPRRYNDAPKQRQQRPLRDTSDFWEMDDAAPRNSSRGRRG